MKKLIKEYKLEAKRLEEYIEALKKELDSETDVDIVNRLRERIRLLSMERYEILADIKDMLKWE